jgi:hypothetical protein
MELVADTQEVESYGRVDRVEGEVSAAAPPDEPVHHDLKGRIAEEQKPQ